MIFYDYIIFDAFGSLVTFSVYLRVTHEREVGALNMIYYDAYVMHT